MSIVGDVAAGNPTVTSPLISTRTGSWRCWWSGSRGWADQLQRRRKLLGRGHGRLTCEVLADISGGVTVDGIATFEERHVAVRPSPSEDQVGAVLRANDAHQVL